ncbi:hypothetical protein EJF18_30865 [Clavispora lusitaniae]|uniref:Uncharacterized protein n=1 Tax=Clavispora lusitaniae TaxID=36911 RepID=A0ACD0WK03_CLALS|nr:hypothetical protein EJF14_30865 [Clavispora lusitaniae]QFZ32819.1 hypothetical protein EJF16_30865 [Clavispora lusitaniae]QFZ38489.1 hypothetical protein EJF15_30865 [Clavispora lusitaniae]QFZ44171.1 hypothetical protein EJF18_30865 [Clavispora lusitaniae]QFZ49849.1 hypothetical protein EJF17_30865 [Clavispora lusitaniae]
MDFYQPTFLFRQNAMRRSSSPELNPNGSSESLISKNSSWLLRPNTSDVELVQKACSLDRLNIKSNYWKIPDGDMNLTALAASDQHAASPLVAVSSANTDSNLFVYELDSLNHYLTHHTTISLPNIHGLAWVPNQQSRFLVSGNNKGYAHLISVPLPASYGGDPDGEECAEIVKRFNHRKHLRAVGKDPSSHLHSSTCVSKLGFLDDRLVSIYDDTLFVWNMNDCHQSMRPRPESIAVVPGIRNFDSHTADWTTLAVCGGFGLSLYDVRSATYSVPYSGSKLHLQGAQIRAGVVRWHPENEHVMASAHDDGVVRLWDIRKNETLGEIKGHERKKITTMAWNHGDLFTGASDGNIVHWDLSSDVDIASAGDKLSRCTMKEGVNSVRFDATTNTLMDTLTERQCGTLLPASNNQIVDMCHIGSGTDCKILSIDSSAFLGLHSRIYAALGAEEKTHYTSADLALIAREESSIATLVDSSESLIKPLCIRRDKAPQTEPKPSVSSAKTLIPSDVSPTITSAEKFVSSPETLVSSPKKAYSSALSPLVSTNKSESEFDFLDMWSDSRSSVVSLHSVDSAQNSPFSNNDSAYTLSTTATIVGPSEEQKNPKSLAYLDSELDRICSEFQVGIAA